MFGSSFLLVPGVMPFWALLARWRYARAGLMGVNASVVGLLAAALVSPIATSALLAPMDAVVALGAFALLLWTRLPVWMIVAACAALGAFWL
jgi:chromate transporter